MVRSTIPPALALLGLLVGACAESKVAPFPGPPSGYGYAYATQDCAPWDGPAVTLYLVGAASDSLPPIAPHLQISLFMGLDHLSAQRLSWPDDARKGNALKCASPDSCSPIREGRIEISEVSADGTVWGEVHLVAAAGDTIRGGFRALWRPRRIMCG